MKEKTLEVIEELGMVLHEYDFDEVYYVSNFVIDGSKVKETHTTDEAGVVFEIKDDLSYAQVAMADGEFKELTIEECLEHIRNLKKLEKVLSDMKKEKLTIKLKK